MMPWEPGRKAKGTDMHTTAIISRSIRLAWNNKVLWFFAVLLAIGVFGPELIAEERSPSFAIEAFAFLLMTFAWPALTRSCVRVLQHEQPSLAKGIEDGAAFFGRYLWINLVFAVLALLFGGVAISIIDGLGSVISLLLGLILLVSVGSVYFLYTELCTTALVVEDLSVTKAYVRGWDVLSLGFWKWIGFSVALAFTALIGLIIAAVPTALILFLIDYLFSGTPFSFVFWVVGVAILLTLSGFGFTAYELAWNNAYIEMRQREIVDSPMDE